MYGIGYVVDPSSAYSELSENTEAIDFIQFPQETLISMAGDCDDISVLYASMLEASGIPAAFITIPGHIFLAFKLETDEWKAKRNFPHAQDLFYINEESWLPVEITLVEDGFLASWQTGAKQIRESKGEFGFFPVREAWATFPAAEYETSGLAYMPNPNDVVTRYSRELNRFLQKDVRLQIAELDRDIRQKGETPILLNRKGVIYGRFGFLDDAKIWFERVVSREDFYPSLMNLGNIHYLSNNASEAAVYYNRALRIKPDSEKALIGLAKVSSEMEDYNTANAALATLQAVNPIAAGEISHLGTESIGRASAAQNKEADEWSE
jgi:tetratricopeptide (TPR) repeat protein